MCNITVYQGPANGCGNLQYTQTLLVMQKTQYKYESQSLLSMEWKACWKDHCNTNEMISQQLSVKMSYIVSPVSVFVYSSVKEK